MKRIFRLKVTKAMGLHSLRRSLVASLLLLSGLVGSCAQESPTSPPRLVTPSLGAAGLDETAAALKEGMPYAKLRTVAIDAGWQPVLDPACSQNVVGDDYKETCRIDPNSNACSICDRLPELSSCSGDAYCGMYFAKGSRRLHVVAYGDFADWNDQGEESQFTVSGWDVSKKP